MVFAAKTALPGRWETDELWDGSYIRRGAAVQVAVASQRIDQDGFHARRPSTDHVDRVDVPHVPGVCGGDAGGCETKPEDAGIGLLHADEPRIDDEGEAVAEAGGGEQVSDGAIGI